MGEQLCRPQGGWSSMLTWEPGKEDLGRLWSVVLESP